MSLDRRTLLKNVGLGMGAASLASMSNIDLNAAAKANIKGPKRVIFFLQNHGIHPETCMPEGMTSSGSLSSKKLPKHMAPLQKYRDRMHIISGLHGVHATPHHGAFFGALGGYRSGGVKAATIDSVLSSNLPETVVPHLCIGMDALSSMVTKPTIARLSASGPSKPIYMYSNPNHLYQLMFGGVSKGEMRKEYDVRSQILKEAGQIAAIDGGSLSNKEKKRYDNFPNAFNQINDTQKKLLTVSDHLAKFAPTIDSRYTEPKFETNWHDVLLDLGIAALKSGITNTLTVGSGRGFPDGSWEGIGVEQRGHNIGHQRQTIEFWTAIRQYNCRMMVKIIEELEKVPEGNGTMMDNTLIVYTSDNADKQHTKGKQWPVVLLGNFAGRIKEGQFTQLKESRPINALYGTLLHATTGKSYKRFNMSETVAAIHEKGDGPLKEILA